MRTDLEARRRRRSPSASDAVPEKTRKVMYGRGARPVAFVALVAAAIVLLAASPATAHDTGISTGDYAIDGARVSAELVMARADLVEVVPEVDSNRDGIVTEGELRAATAKIEEDVVRTIEVRGDARLCAGSFSDAELVEKDGVVVRAKYACDRPPRIVTIDVNPIAAMRRGHRHLARLHARAGADGGVTELNAVLDRDDHRLAIELGRDESTGVSSQAAPSSRATGLAAFMKMGAMHVLAGFDHLLFLFALVLVGGRARSIVGVVTAFTVAHSITLAVATLCVWTPPARIVEPAIALSIAYVGVENFFVKSAAHRWRITFPFGLVHGFGFASALGEVRVARTNVGHALLGFNLGVEAGQLAVLALLLPLLAILRKKSWLGDRQVKIASAIVVAIGTAWFVLRIVRPPT